LGRAPLRDRAPESDFRGYFSDTETKLDEGNTAISRHFERGPLWYALETDWLAEAAGFEPLHLRIIRWRGSWPETSLAMTCGTTKLASEMRMFESSLPELRVWANSASEMRTFALTLYRRGRSFLC
jgi:hypothetical protein